MCELNFQDIFKSQHHTLLALTQKCRRPPVNATNLWIDELGEEESSPPPVGLSSFVSVATSAGLTSSTLLLFLSEIMVLRGSAPLPLLPPLFPPLLPPLSHSSPPQSQSCYGDRSVCPVVNSLGSISAHVLPSSEHQCSQTLILP